MKDKELNLLRMYCVSSTVVLLCVLGFSIFSYNKLNTRLNMISNTANTNEESLDNDINNADSDAQKADEDINSAQTLIQQIQDVVGYPNITAKNPLASAN